MSNNKFPTFPIRICFLTSLITIRYEQTKGNKVTSIPESIIELKNLEKLNLNNNELERLPESIGKCGALRLLSLAENNIKDLPDSICDLKELKLLDLTGNKIDELPVGLWRLPGLEAIKMTGNPLKNPPKLVAESGNIGPIGRYIFSAEQREEKLLQNMMTHTAENLAIEDFDRMCIKLKLPITDIISVTSNREMSEKEHLMMLFGMWRKTAPVSAVEAQERFLHTLDLVDLPKLISRLRAMRIYAKALKF